VNLDDPWNKRKAYKVTVGQQSAQLGVLPGDRIISYNDKIIDDNNYEEIKKKLYAGAACILTFERIIQTSDESRLKETLRKEMSVRKVDSTFQILKENNILTLDQLEGVSKKDLEKYGLEKEAISNILDYFDDPLPLSGGMILTKTTTLPNRHSRQKVQQTEFKKISLWLESMGLKQYEQKFKEANYISMQKILHMDSNEIKKMTEEVGCKTGSAQRIRNNLKKKKKKATDSRLSDIQESKSEPKLMKVLRNDIMISKVEKTMEILKENDIMTVEQLKEVSDKDLKKFGLKPGSVCKIRKYFDSSSKPRVSNKRSQQFNKLPIPTN